MGLVLWIGWIYHIVKNYILDMILDSWAWIREMITEAFIPWLVESMPENLRSFFEGLDIAGIASMVQDITWLLPVWGSLGIMATAYAICGGVRLVRWVLAAIPTIGG